MNAPPVLRVRVLGALALAPMTDGELARCLDRPKPSVEKMRMCLLKRGQIRVVGCGPRTRKCGRHPHRYALVAGT